MHDVTLCFAVLSPVSNYCAITFSVTVQSDNAFYLKKCGPYNWQKYGNYVFEKNNMTMNSRYIIWINVHLAVNFLTLLTLMSPPPPPHSNDVTSWQSSSSAEKVLSNVAPFFYHHNVEIQHLASVNLVSHRLISLISEVRSAMFLELQWNTYVMLDQYQLHT